MPTACVTALRCVCVLYDECVFVAWTEILGLGLGLDGIEVCVCCMCGLD